MLRTIASVAVVLLLSIGGGAASVWYALGAMDGVGAMRIGAWTAYPASGTPAADPYARARIARDAILPLGLGEGLVFRATGDSAGNELVADCRYRVEGDVPSARIWTLHADVAEVGTDGDPAAALHSLGLLRRPDNSFEIAASASAMPGNWLRLPAAGRFEFVLTLYDTPVAGSASIAEISLPQILRTGCDG